MKASKYKIPKMVYLKWLDHYSHKDNWSPPDFTTCKEGLVCETVGFLMHESKECFHVSLNYCDKGEQSDSADSIAVLKRCVLKKRFLK